jgi:hypothetical protein
LPTIDTGVYYNLGDLQKGHDPQGNVAKIINTLWEAGQGDFVQDAKFKLANDLTTETFTRQLTEPTGSWGGSGVGVKGEKVATKQVKEDIFVLQSRSIVPLLDVKKSPNPEQFLSERNKLHLKGMVKNLTRYAFYGRSGLSGFPVSEEKAPLGLMPRFNKLADFPESIVNNGGIGGSECSVWAIKHGPGGLYFAIPRDGKSFIDENPLGVRDALDALGNPYSVIVTEYTMQLALCIEDVKGIQRVCNIKTTGSTGLFDEDFLIDALENMEDMEGVVIYMPKKVHATCWKLLKDKGNVNFSVRDAFGGPILTFGTDGVPVRKMGSTLLRYDEADVA